MSIGTPHSIGVKVLNSDIVGEFKLQSREYAHFQTNTLGKGMNLLILPAMREISPWPIFNKDGFGIK